MVICSSLYKPTLKPCSKFKRALLTPAINLNNSPITDVNILTRFKVDTYPQDPIPKQLFKEDGLPTLFWYIKHVGAYFKEAYSKTIFNLFAHFSSFKKSFPEAADFTAVKL